MASTIINNIKEGGGGGVLRISATYQPHLTRDEHRPKVKVWISFDQHYKTNGERWTISRKLYGKQSGGFKQYFNIPLPLDKELAAFPLDAAVHFQVYSAMTDSHGGGDDPEENFEKDGSGRLYLAQLFSGGQGHAITKPLKIALNVQSCIIEQAKPVLKGNFLIQLEKKGTLVKRKLVFAAPSSSDVVPGNLKNLQTNIFTLIQRNLIIFDKKVMKAANVEFELTLAEGDRVHAPLFVNSTGLISPGECFFDNTSDHGTEWDEGFMSNILDISISRTGWTRQRYVKAIQGQHGSDSTKKPTWSEYLTALEITWQSLTIPSNSLPYIADLAIEKDDRIKKVVESFDDPLSKNDGDCEDVAWLIGEIYRGLRDGTNFKKTHVLMAQEAIRLYKACGVLCTVTSRNIDESSGNEGRPDVGSKRDLNVETGAHMTIVAMPRVYFWEMLGRTTSKITPVMEHSEPEFVTRHPLTGKIQRQDWEKNLPVINAEGTGGLRCIATAREGLFESRPEKETALLDTLKQREAFARLLTGFGPQQRNQMSKKELQVLRGFEGMQVLRMQDALVNNPNKRLNTFFRMVTEICPIPEHHQEMFHKEATGLVQDPCSSGPNDPYSLRKIIPVQMGPRQQGKTSHGSVKITSGVNMVDIVNKQLCVGGLRETKAHSEEMNAIRTSALHLPPTEELRLPSREDVLKTQKKFKTLSRAFGPVITKVGKLSQQDVLKNTTSVFMYWRLKKFGGVTQARQLGESLRKNALVMQAELHLDHVAEGVATVRLQARVVTSDMVSLNPVVADKLLGPRTSSGIKNVVRTPVTAAKFSYKPAQSSMPKSNRKKKDPVRLSKFNMKEILHLSKTKTYGGSCLKNYLIRGDASKTSDALKMIGEGGLSGNGGESKDIAGFLGSIINFVIQGYQKLRWHAVIAIDNVFPDMTALQTWIHKLSSADTPVKALKQLICEGYGNFLTLFDWALEAFPARSDEIIAAKLFKERVQQCTDLLDSIEDYAVLLLREVLSWLESAIDFLYRLFSEALGYAGSLIGKLVSAMTAESQTKTVISGGVRRMVKQSTRLLFFGCSMVALATQTAAAIVKKPGLQAKVAAKIGGNARTYIKLIVDYIGVRLGEYLSNWMAAFQRQLRNVADFFGKVIDKVIPTSVWQAFAASSQFMAEKFATVEDTIQTVVAWIIKIASRLKDRVLSFLNAMIAGGMETIMNVIRKFSKLIKFDKPPIPQDKFEFMEYTLGHASGIDPMKRAAFRAARDNKDNHLEKTQDEINESMEFTVLADMGEQISLRWEASGLIADSILGESMLEDVSIFEDLIPKLFGSGFTNLDKFSLSEETRVAYYRTMLEAMTVKLEPEQIIHVAETVRNFRYPAAWPGLKHDIDISTTSSKIGGKTKPDFTISDVSEDDEKRGDFEIIYSKKRTEDTQKLLTEQLEAKEVKKRMAETIGLLMLQVAKISAMRFTTANQKIIQGKVADNIMAELFPKIGEIHKGQTVVFNRKAVLAWLKDNGTLEGLVWMKIAYEWAISNPHMLLFVRQGLSPARDRRRVIIASLLFTAVFGAMFYWMTTGSIKAHEDAEVEMELKREIWWTAFQRTDNQKVVKALFGKEKLDYKQDALSFRELLRKKKTEFLIKLSGMNLETLQKKENLGWFNHTSYGKSVSFSDVWTGVTGIFSMERTKEPSKVENLLAKFDFAVESIGSDYVKIDEDIYSSVGDMLWGRIRGFLMSLSDGTIPATFLSSVAFGYPVGTVALGAATSYVIASMAYFYASGAVTLWYTGDRTAIDNAKWQSAWLAKKVFHVVAVPLFASQLLRMFGSLSYVFNAWGLLFGMGLTLALPGFSSLAFGIGGLAITATNKTLSLISTGNKDPLLVGPRDSKMDKTRLDENKEIVDLIKVIEVERLRILRQEILDKVQKERHTEKLDQKSVEHKENLDQQQRRLELTLWENQQNAILNSRQGQIVGSPSQTVNLPIEYPQNVQITQNPAAPTPTQLEAINPKYVSNQNNYSSAVPQLRDVAHIPATGSSYNDTYPSSGVRQRRPSKGVSQDDNTVSHGPLKPINTMEYATQGSQQMSSSANPGNM